MLRKYPAVSQLTHALFFWSVFWPGHVAFGILVPQPKIDAVSPAVEAESYPLDHKGKILFFPLWLQYSLFTVLCSS